MFLLNAGRIYTTPNGVTSNNMAVFNPKETIN
jgi:hypothetical protein